MIRGRTLAINYVKQTMMKYCNSTFKKTKIFDLKMICELEINIICFDVEFTVC